MTIINWQDRNGIPHTMRCADKCATEHVEDLELLGYKYEVVTL